MSLVHEPLIEILNRRFVSTYYNAFPGPGHDRDAAAFCRGKSVRYGAIFTPDGQLVASFGYNMKEVLRSFKSALKKHPHLAQASDEEKELLEKAKQNQANLELQLEAAQLHGWLLEFDQAQAVLDRVLKRELTAVQKARVRYAKAHLALLDIEQRNPDQLKKELAGIENLPRELELERALDQLSLDVQLRPERGFFTGWAFKKGCDLPAIAANLEKWIKEAPNSVRLGQMYFYLGLARMGQGDKDGANKIWQAHADQLPEDRYAMLSRLHHTSYKFSPYNTANRFKQGGGIIIRDPGRQPPKKK